MLSAESLQQLLLQQQVGNVSTCSSCSYYSNIPLLVVHVLLITSIDLSHFLGWLSALSHTHMLLIPPLQMMQSQLLSLGGAMDAGGLQRLKEKEQQPGDYQALQARIVQLEGQVGFKQEASTVCFNILTRAASPSCVLLSRWRPCSWNETRARCCWKTSSSGINRTWSSLRPHTSN